MLSVGFISETIVIICLLFLYQMFVLETHVWMVGRVNLDTAALHVIAQQNTMGMTVEHVSNNHIDIALFKCMHN